MVSPFDQAPKRCQDLQDASTLNFVVSLYAKVPAYETLS